MRLGFRLRLGLRLRLWLRLGLIEVEVEAKYTYE